jgi:type VI protein secretion system component VasF
MSGTESEPSSPGEQNADAADERRTAVEIWLFFILIAALLAALTLTSPRLSDAAVTHAAHVTHVTHVTHTLSHR